MTTRMLTLVALSLACQAAQAFPTYAGGEGFRGAELMSQDERKLHVARLQAMQTLPECQEAHEVELQRRAKAGNATLPTGSATPAR